MKWLDEFKQKTKVMQSIILTGNVRDEFWNSDEQQYQLLPEFLYFHLKELGYKLVNFWIPPEHLHFHNAEDARTFKALQEKESEDEEDEGEDYDLGEILEDKEPSLVQTRSLNDYVIEFQRIVELSKSPLAGIINWGDYAFSQNNNQVSTQDKDVLVSLSTYSLETGIKPKINSSELKKSTSTLIIITSNLSYIPHSFYQPDPRIKIISIEKPDLKMRRRYIKQHISDFNVDLKKGEKQADFQEISEDLAAASDQLTLVDLRMMMEFANKSENPVDSAKLVQLYKFGTKESPWEQLDDLKLKRLEDDLNLQVKGQEPAINHVVQTIIKASLGLAGLQHSANRSKPKGTLFFVGPTGVGKTELAKGIARFLFGDESAFIRFDMSEYKQEHSVQKLIGAPPSYVGFESGGQLTNAVIERPFSVVLFDEIEKAHEKILDIFLGILEDGRLTDGRGETAYFSETIIIFTSNLGAAAEAKHEIGNRRGHYEGAIETHFFDVLGRPEILNRIGENIVVFNSITDIKIKQSILTSKLRPLHEFIEERFGVHLHIHEATLLAIVKSSEKKFGGRGILNKAESALINPLATFIFQNKKRMLTGRILNAFMNEKNIEFKLEEAK